MTRRRIRPALLALAALASLSPSCGRKTAPKPPEFIRPEKIAALEARNVADGIELGWKRPRDYVDGSRMYDLAGFRIERGGRDGSWMFLAEIAVDDNDRFRPIKSFKYVDSAVAEGEAYHYRLRSFTVDRDESDPTASGWIVRETPPAVVVPGRAATPRD